MKKFLGFVLIMSLTLCGLPFSSNAVVEERFEFNNRSVEIIYSGNELSAAKIKSIANFIADDSIESSSTYGILCIFGHKLEYADVVDVEHNYYSASPFCRRTIYEVETCSRESCSYMNKTIISQNRISSCHG